MRIVIVGDGKVGTTMTEYLSNEGHDIVVIDRNPRVIENAVNNSDVIGICGNGASYDVLLEAGAGKADIVIAATSSDEINILCCLTAKKLGARNTIARVRNPDYAKQLRFMREELGLSMVVNPEFESAREIARMLRSPATITRDDFSKGRIELAEIRLGDDSALNGMPLSSLHDRYKVRILVCAVQRGDHVHIPDGNFVLNIGDKVHFTGAPAELDSFLKQLGLIHRKIKTVAIIGGGKITYYLAKQLEELGMHMKIIEQDELRCQELSRRLERAEIIHGDGSDQRLLLEEGVDHADACVALTDMDEENMVISMYASSIGVPKVITKINRNSYTSILGRIGLESIVSPKALAANRIVRYVRAMNNAAGSSNVQTLYKIVDNQVEALEFQVNENTKFTGVAIKDLPLKDDVLIAGIVRGGKVIIPSGSDVIQKMDNVVVVTTNQFFDDLDDILK